jgi:hypothetical protein
MKTPYRMLFSLTRGTLGYFVPQDEWATGHNRNYEEQISVHQTIGNKTRDRLIEMIRQDNESF